MRATHHASPDDIDITSIWGSLKRSGRSLILASLLTGGLTFAALSMMAPRFMSEAQLQVVAKETSNPFTSPKREGSAPDSAQYRVDKEAVNTHVRALMSPDLANRIAGQLKLGELKEFNNALGSVDSFDAAQRMIGLSGPRAGESEHDRVLNAFFKRLEVYAPKESRFIGVRFTSIDPELAASVANALAETYRQSLARQSVDETDEVQKALEPKIARMRDEVAQAEAAIERFKGAKDIFKGGPQKTGLNEQQLGELTAELTKVKGARSEAEARARSARELMRAGSADALPDVQKSPLIQNLVQQRVRLEREISELSATLLPGHPRMKQLKADLDGLRKQITGEVGKIVDSLEKEAKVAAFREASVASSINEIKSQVVTTSTDEVELRQLEAVARSKRSELDRLQSQYEANRARADSRVVPIEAQIVSQARPSSVPIFPKKAPYTGLVVVATLLFGIAWIVTRALLVGARGVGSGPHPLRRADDRNTMRAPAPAMAEASEQPLSRVAVDEPRLGARAEFAAAADAIRDEEAPAEIATIAKLARFIRDQAPEKGGYRTLITGETNGIDAATEARALAEDLVRDSLQVVIVDWAVGRDGFAERLGLDAAPGFTDLLRGDVSFEDVIQSVPNGSAHIIAAGTGLAAGDLVEQIDIDKLNLLLDALDEAYDHILVVGANEEARSLFEAIQGRFDAAVTVAEGKRRVSVLQDPPGTFLGFEVTDIALIRFVRGEEKASMPQRVVRRQSASGRVDVLPG
ncbi:MAG: lipopolysaccharide biosynthesis protein [Hyphomicrobiaceae bacterium]|nr:lipopolysaccharide biosynthesis protein [Hyphomicrobiaceae bacterium]